MQPVNHALPFLPDPLETLSFSPDLMTLREIVPVPEVRRQETPRQLPQPLISMQLRQIADIVDDQQMRVDLGTKHRESLLQSLTDAHQEIARLTNVSTETHARHKQHSAFALQQLKAVKQANEHLQKKNDTLSQALADLKRTSQLQFHAATVQQVARVEPTQTAVAQIAELEETTQTLGQELIEARKQLAQARRDRTHALRRLNEAREKRPGETAAEKAMRKDRVQSLEKKLRDTQAADAEHYKEFRDQITVAVNKASEEVHAQYQHTIEQLNKEVADLRAQIRLLLDETNHLRTARLQQRPSNRIDYSHSQTFSNDLPNA